MVRFALELLDSYGTPVLRDVVTDMRAPGIPDQGAMAILCEQRCKRRPGPPPPTVQLGAHVVERLTRFDV